MRTVLFAILVVTFSALSGYGYAAPVQVANPGAEIDDGKGGAQGYRSWQANAAQASFSRDNNIKHSGEYSLYIGNKSARPANAAFMVGVKVIDGLNYKASAWVKTKAATAYVAVRFLDENAYLEGGDFTGEVLKGTRDWQNISVQAKAPEGAVRADIYLVCRQGKAWFDDLKAQDNLLEYLGKKMSFLDKRLDEISLTPEKAEEVKKRLTLLKDKLSSIKAGAIPSLEERRQLHAKWQEEEIEKVLSQSLRENYLERLRREMTKVWGHDFPYLAGWKNSIERVFLYDLPVDFQVSKTGHLYAFKGEVEAIQLVISPLKGNLDNVEITVSSLQGDTGDSIPAESVKVNPVGFVKIQKMASAFLTFDLETEYLGWWPDVLLENFPFPVDKGATQPVWISVEVPRGVKAGTYRGEVRIRPENAMSLQLGLEVRVWDFSLPEKWHFRNVLSWWEPWATGLYGEKWTQQMRKAFLDLLVEHHVNLVSTYGDYDEPFTQEEIKAAASRGQSVIFPLTLKAGAGLLKKAPYFGVWGGGEGTRERMERILGKWVPFLKAEGLFDRAIVYGFDEGGAEWYPCIKEVADFLEQEYGLPLLMAGVDQTNYGSGSILGQAKNIIYCPMMNWYNPQVVKRARRRGASVWWYEVEWPLEKPLIWSRMIGWMTYKMNSDGFLLWCVNRWKGNDKPIGNQIKTPWNPFLDGVLPSSSALLVYPGENGPLSSLRLANLRDGAEDYDILKEAEEVVREKRISSALLRKLEDLLNIPDDFIRNSKEYNKDPGALLKRRKVLGEILDHKNLATFQLTVKLNGKPHVSTPVPKEQPVPEPVPMTSAAAGAVKVEVALTTSHTFNPPGLIYHIVGTRPFRGSKGHMIFMPEGGRGFPGIDGNKWYGMRVMAPGQWTEKKSWKATVDFRPSDPNDPLAPMAEGVHGFFATAYAYQVAELNNQDIQHRIPIKMLVDDTTPVVDAGRDVLNALPGGPARLLGTAKDALSGIDTIVWTDSAGKVVGVSLKANVPVTKAAEVFTLTVTDKAGNSAADTVTVKRR